MYENVHTPEDAYSSTAILDLLLNTSAKKKKEGGGVWHK